MANTGNWKQPLDNVQLLDNDVHVWSALLDVSEDKLHSLLQTLDFEERTRAERFYFEQDRIRFIVSHGLLRIILGSYVNIEPEKLQYSYNSQGKPYLPGSFQGKKLQFTMSHSHEFALYAVTFDRQVGIDLEHIYLFAETDSFANCILTKREKATWYKYTANHRLEILFRYWTCKEAFVKARGDGLALPLEKIQVSLSPGVEARLLSVNSRTREALRWSLQELHFLPGLAAALIVEGHDYHLNQWQWSYSNIIH